MSTSTSTEHGRSKFGKLMLQIVVGALGGMAVSYGLLTAVDSAGIDMENPSRIIALGTAAIFGLMGIFVGLGVMVPGPGSRLLNVEDETDLLEQRTALVHGALLFIALAAILLGLALGGAGGILSTAASATIAAAGGLAAVAIGVTGRAEGDELMRSLAREASAYAMYACTILLGLWAAAAHLGAVRWIDPLSLISALLLVQYAAIMVVCAKRGLLSPR